MAVLELLVVSVISSFLLVKFFPLYLLSQSFVWTAIQIFFPLCILWLLWVVLLYPKYYSPLRHLPQPKNNHILFGQWKRIMKESTGDPLLDWMNNIPNEGLIRYLDLFNRERIVITNPAALAQVLNEKSYDFVRTKEVQVTFENLMGKSIILAEGDVHKMQRKNLKSAFAFRNIKNMYPLFWNKAWELADAITKQIQESTDLPGRHQHKSSAVIDLSSWFGRAALDMLGVAGLGHDFNAMQDSSLGLSATYAAYRNAFVPAKQVQMLYALKVILPRWLVNSLPVSQHSQIQATIAPIKDFCREIVSEKHSNSNLGEKASPDLLSVAMESKCFSNANLVDQLMSFMAAGTQTTATTLAWTVYLLCRHPEVQRRLRTEIQTSFPLVSISSDINPNDLENLPYLNAVCCEVLRLYPPLPLIAREAAVPTEILGQYIPKGTNIIICPWAINKSKPLWGADASEFKPERWLDASGKLNKLGGAHSNYSFMSFLHGPRSCIGQGFARAELLCTMVAIMSSFEMELESPDMVAKAKGRLIARPQGGIKARCHLLDHA